MLTVNRARVHCSQPVSFTGATAAASPEKKLHQWKQNEIYLKFNTDVLNFTSILTLLENPTNV